MANPALLDIGTASSRIDLLNPRGFHLSEWRPKALGTDVSFAESALEDGRQPAASRDLNVIETFELKLNTFDQDDAARMVQQLRRMLRDGLKYWTSGDPSLTPVYLSARSSCETNTRYALVYDARMPEDDNYYRQPFLQFDGDAVMDALSLVVERGPWLENAPGTGTCVQTSATQGWSDLQTSLSESIAASTDDCDTVIGNVASFDLTAITIYIGDCSARGGPEFAGLCFQTVNVPQGAEIIYAYLQLHAASTQTTGDCEVLIHAEDTDDAATFSTYADLVGRILTTNGNHWRIPRWTAGTDYISPDISTIIQEVVDRPGWVANNDMAILLIDGGSTTDHYRQFYSWDDAGEPAPILVIVYATSGESSYGRAATCLNEVYIANKHNIAQLTHLYHYTAVGAVWSANLMGDATPFAFLPAAIANNDIVYFGIQSTLADSGPFSSLVFDIGTAAAYAGATAALTWQYWNGAAWVALTVQDNTNGGSGAFDTTGVNSVHWVQPSAWAAVAINGVTAYWVRAIATIGGGDSISTPTQANRDVYTIVTPRVEIAAAQVAGDVPALAQIKIQNWADAPYSTAPVLYSTRIIAGLRSYDRGADFTPFINLCDEQNPDGIDPQEWAGGSTTFTATALAPAGVAAYFNSTGANPMANRVYIDIGNTIAYQYFGKFRAFVRGWQVAGGTVGNVGVRLAYWSGAAMAYTPTAYFTALNSYQALDMGLVTLPGCPQPSTQTNYDSIEFYLQASSSSASDDAYFTDVILMPVDEWSGDFVRPLYGSSAGYNGMGGVVDYRTLLDLDSITYPKYNLRANIRYAATGASAANWEPRCPGPMILLNNERQRLWFLALRNIQDTDTWYCEPEIAHSVQVWRQQRYETLRGAG